MNALEALRYLMTSEDENAANWRSSLTTSEYSQHLSTLSRWEEAAPAMEDPEDLVDKFFKEQRVREEGRTNPLQQRA